MNSRRKVVLSWLPAVLYMGLIWTLSSLPLQFPMDPVPFKDKGIHFVEYAVLAVLLNHALHGTWPRAQLRVTAFYATVATVLWGLLDEIHQAYVPNRFSDAMDLLADTIGAVLGTLIFLGAVYVRNGRNQRASR